MLLGPRLTTLSLSGLIVIGKFKLDLSISPTGREQNLGGEARENPVNKPVKKPNNPVERTFGQTCEQVRENRVRGGVVQQQKTGEQQKM